MQDQFEAHVHDGLLSVYTYYGSERTKDVKLLAKQHVVLTTYQTLSSEFSKVLYLQLTLVINSLSIMSFLALEK